MTRKDSHALLDRSAGLRFPIGLLLFLLMLTFALGSADRVVAGNPRAQVEPAAPTACPPPNTLTFGETIQCSIDAAGEVDSFTFSGATGDRIRVAVAETSGSFTAFMEVRRPNGTKVCETIVGKLTCLLDATGTHTLLVYAFNGSGTGNYGLYSQRLNNPVGCTAIAFGALPTLGSISMAAEHDCFTFSLTAGSRVRTNGVETGGTLSVFQEIVRPNGTTLCETIVGKLTCRADTAGTHTLLLYDFNGPNTGAYSVYAQRLNNPIGCAPIAFGALPATGSIGVAAEHDCFTFNLTAGDRVRTNLIETGGTLGVFQEIVRPDGTTLCETIVGKLTCVANVTGTHTLLLYDFNGTRTGNYSAYVQRLNNPVGCTPVAYGAAADGAIGVAAETDCYTFSGAQNKSVRITVVTTSGTLGAYKEVTKPNGDTLCGNIVSQLDCSLNTSGSHTILVDDFNGTRTGQYRLTLTCLTPPCGGTPPAPSFFASAAGSGTVGGVAFAPADILAYNGAANTWQMHYDGSDVAATRNVGAFAFEGGNLLLVFSASQPIAGQGTFTPWDVARFTPTSVGPNTAGAFGWQFDGSDVGLTLAGEKIDALGRASNGRLLISTVGVAKVPGPGGAVITAQDEDVLAFTPTSAGQNTAGTWALYFDGTPIPGLGVEDINGFWENPATGDRYITILGAFNLAGVAGDGKDIVKLTPNAGAPGGYAPSLAWDGSILGFPSTLDAVEMGQP